MLDTPEFSGRHTAVNICTAVQNVLRCCKVDLGQLSGVVTDEAANMMAATRLLKTQEIAPHLYAVVCACHRLQTAIRHCMNLSSVSSLLSQSRRLVGHFQHSDIVSEAFHQCQTLEGFVQAPNILSDNATRLNSMFLMIQQLHKLRFPISIVLSNPTVSKHLTRHLTLAPHHGTRLSP